MFLYGDDVDLLAERLTDPVALVALLIFVVSGLFLLVARVSRR